MKKIFVAFASVTILAASAFFMSCSSESDSPAHEHTFGEWTITEQPTQEAEGKRERECSVCHYKTEEKIAKLNHVHAKGLRHAAVAGTCRTKGTIEYYDCIAAGCEIKLDAAGNPLYSIEGELDPERHEGSAAITAIDEMNHKGIYSCCYAVWVSEEKHNFGKMTVSVLPAEDAEGKGTVECIDCKYKEEKTIAKLDHAHSKGTKHSEVTGSCVTMGTVEYYDCQNENCAVKLDKNGNPLKSIEGELFPYGHETEPVFTAIDETAHKVVCNSCGYVWPAEEHYFDKWSWTVTALPSAGTEGKKENECFDCGYKKIETIARLDHVHEKGEFHLGWGGNCIEKGIVGYYDCKNENCVIKLNFDGIPLLTLEDDFDPEKHFYSTSMIQTNTSHKKVYDCCGVVVSEDEHTWNSGTIIIRPTLTQTGLKKTVCTVCNYTKIEPVAKLEPVHTFDTV